MCRHCPAAPKLRTCRPASIAGSYSAPAGARSISMKSLIVRSSHSTLILPPARCPGSPPPCSRSHAHEQDQMFSEEGQWMTDRAPQGSISTGQAGRVCAEYVDATFVISERLTIGNRWWASR